MNWNCTKTAAWKIFSAAQAVPCGCEERQRARRGGAVRHCASASLAKVTWSLPGRCRHGQGGQHGQRNRRHLQLLYYPLLVLSNSLNTTVSMPNEQTQQSAQGRRRVEKENKHTVLKIYSPQPPVPPQSETRSPVTFQSTHTRSGEESCPSHSHSTFVQLFLPQFSVTKCEHLGSAFFEIGRALSSCYRTPYITACVAADVCE